MTQDIEAIATHVVESSFNLHRDAGPGLLEDFYGTLLPISLERRGLQVERDCYVPFEFEGRRFDRALRVDLLVEKQVVVELKSVEKLAPVHFKQTLTYLRLLDLRLGFLINFGCGTLKEGLHRIVNRYQPSPSSPLRINLPALPVLESRQRSESSEKE